MAACLLLAGGLKPSALTTLAGVSPLDLLLEPRMTLLDHWARLLTPVLAAGGAGADGGGADGGGGVGIRVIHCSTTPPPLPPQGAGGVAAVTIRQDLQPYRGPAGVARDAGEDLPDDALVLIAEGARVLTQDPWGFVESHLRSGADISVAANPDGSPAGLYLARRGMLSIVPRRGFMDLKEQWLSRAVERGQDVRVYTLAAPGAVPVRTRIQYLRACFRSRHGVQATSWRAQGFSRGVLARGTTGNSIVAPGASVDASALLAHAVVMPGAEVGAGAVVARSLLCAGASVKPGQEVVDAVVTATGVHSDADDLRRGTKERVR